jgi:hypothetical protein
VSPTRYSAVLGGVVPNGSLATATAPLALIGWSTAQLAAFTVNGTDPRRSDLDLIIAPLSLSIGRGAFRLQPGDLPVGVAGTSVTPVPGAVGSLTLGDGDHVDIELALPATDGRLHVDNLALQSVATSVSGGLSAKDAALWNWRTQHWTAVDLSSGTLVVSRAAAFVSADGRVRLRIQAGQGESLNLGTLDQSLGIGVVGRVQ